MSDFVVEVRAVVVCFYRVALGVVGVGVEGVEVCAYSLYGSEVLCKLVEWFGYIGIFNLT